MMAERIGVYKNTYAMVLFVLGLSDALTALADSGRDGLYA